MEHQREPAMGQARQPVTVTVNQLSNCAKKFRRENFVTNLKGEVFPAKLFPGVVSPPLYMTGIQRGETSIFRCNSCLINAPSPGCCIQSPLLKRRYPDRLSSL